MNNTKISISIVFPCYNEEENIEKCLNEAEKILKTITNDYELIVVNDGSTDSTPAILSRIQKHNKKVKIVTHEKNQKLGATLRDGYKNATKNIIFYIDSDFPIDFIEIKRVVRLFDYLNADIITAYRLDRTSEGLKRQIYSYIYNWLIRIIFRLNLKDINFAFKGFRKEVIQNIILKSSGSFINAELLCKAYKLGFRIFQIGTDYFPRARGKSKLAGPGIIIKIIYELFKLYREIMRIKPR